METTTFNQLGISTAGSMTIHTSGAALRQAAAETRRALLDMAAERLDAALDELVVRDGTVAVGHDPERKTTYAELMGGKLFNRQVTDSAPEAGGSWSSFVRGAAASSVVSPCNLREPPSSNAVGRRPTGRRFAPIAIRTLTPIASWPTAGSLSSGKCGKIASLMMKPIICNNVLSVANLKHRQTI